MIVVVRVADIAVVVLVVVRVRLAIEPDLRPFFRKIQGLVYHLTISIGRRGTAAKAVSLMEETFFKRRMRLLVRQVDSVDYVR